MSVTYGFFNSLNGDRRYDAEDFGSVFNGLIEDGVYMSVGERFRPVAKDNELHIRPGRAWFRGTWTYNSATLPLKLAHPDVVLHRVDMAVIEINKSPEVRANTIKMIEGVPATNPVPPKLKNDRYILQVPIAQVYRRAGEANILDKHVTNLVGTSKCPFVVGLVQNMSIDEIVARWESQWTTWFGESTIKHDKMTEDWFQTKAGEFETWFLNLQVALEDDVAANLANKIINTNLRLDRLERYGELDSKLLDAKGNVITDSEEQGVDGVTRFMKYR